VAPPCTTLHHGSTNHTKHQAILRRISHLKKQRPKDLRIPQNDPEKKSLFDPQMSCVIVFTDIPSGYFT